jgi:hypothetical protein
MADQERGLTGADLQGKRQVTFQVDPALIKQMDEIRAFYSLSSGNDLLAFMVARTYEGYLSEKESEQSYDEIITDLQNRLGKLEDKFSRIYEPVEIGKKGTVSGRARSLNTALDSDMQRLIVDLKRRETPSRDIARSLQSEGYTTVTGREITAGWVDKQISRLRGQGLL